MAIENADTLLVNALATLSTETGIDSFGDEGIARALLELPLTQVANLWQQVVANNNQLTLASATGNGLDALGELLGIPRNANTTGVSSPSGMKFYLNSAATSPGVTISAGTMVWNPNAPSAYFTTVSTVTIPIGAKEAFVGIGSPFAGAVSAAPNTLTSCNVPGVLCTNLESMAGTAGEGDAQYQYRLLNGRSGRNSVSSDALRTKILGYAGILDAQMMPLRRGPGTLDIIVFTNEPVPSPYTLQDILGYVQNWTAAGTSIQVYGPTPLTVDITMSLAFAYGVTTSAMASDRQSAIGAIQQYINTYALGETFYPTRLIDTVMNISTDIIDATVTGLRVSGLAVPVGPVQPDAYEQVVAGSIVVS